MTCPVLRRLRYIFDKVSAHTRRQGKRTYWNDVGTENARLSHWLSILKTLHMDP